MSTPRWISVTEQQPPDDLPTFLWGDELVVGVDHPLQGRLCGCHGEYILELADFAEAEDKEVDHGEYVQRMLGTVTHWLDWRPGPAEED